MNGIDPDIERMLSEIQEKSSSSNLSGAREVLLRLQEYVEEKIRERDAGTPFTEKEKKQIAELKGEIHSLLEIIRDINEEDSEDYTNR